MKKGDMSNAEREGSQTEPHERPATGLANMPEVVCDSHGRLPSPDGLCPACKSPRFPMTYCSQCGKECGPGDAGVSDCRDHHHLKCKAKGCRRKTNAKSGFCWQHFDMVDIARNQLGR